MVVPSNRPEKLNEFLYAWRGIFDKHNVEGFIVRDAEPWEGIPDWIPKRTDMIRSWGFWQAYNAGCDYILSLDDDVRPGRFVPDIFVEYEKAFEKEYPLTEYLDVGSFTSINVPMRGYPYKGRNRQVAVQYGGWDGVPDLDAKTQLLLSRKDFKGTFYCRPFPVPKGTAATCCAMNFAFRREYTPIMFQLPLLDGKYNRFGDIWSGLIQKRVLDSIGKVMLINGLANVLHERASDPYTNLKKEIWGLAVNEDVWTELGTPWKKGMIPAYFEITDRFCTLFPKEYSDWFKHCREQWIKLF